MHKFTDVLRTADFGNWQSADVVANYLWVTCVERVHVLCVSLAQALGFVHSRLWTFRIVCKTPRVTHTLYKVCTQALHSTFSKFHPVNLQFYTSSTGFITKTTTLSI